MERDSSKELGEQLDALLPTEEDFVLHGRPILSTPYRGMWLETLRLLKNFVHIPVNMGMSRGNVYFSVTACPIACIDMRTHNVYLNPSFMRVWVKSHYDLAGVLLHELLHPILDPYKKDAVTQAYNYASDAIINSIIYRISPLLTSFFTAFYENDFWPHSFLRPGNLQHWEKAVRTPDYMKGMLVPVSNTHVSYYATLFGDTPEHARSARPSIPQIIEAFFPEGQTNFGQDRSYSGMRGKGMDKEAFDKLPQDVKDRIRKMSAAMDKEYPMSADEEECGVDKKEGDQPGGKQAGNGGALEEHIIKTKKREGELERNTKYTQKELYKYAQEAARSVKTRFKQRALTPNDHDSVSEAIKLTDTWLVNNAVAEAYLKASIPDVRNIILQKCTFKPLPNATVIPRSPSRTGISLMSSGCIPTFWRRGRTDTINDGRSTQVYMDASGSMWDCIEWVIPLVVSMKKASSEIWVFSTDIYKAEIVDLKRGRIKSTGGTSFDTVVQHFLKSDSRKCLLITDGYDSVSDKLAAQCRAEKKELFCLITSNAPPNKGIVVNAQRWAKEVFLQKSEWWKELK